MHACRSTLEDPTSLKTGELERLAAVFRENPRSTVFVSLAQAYLGDGRVAEAMEVLSQGLANYPDHAEARLCLGRSLMALHKWKEAEAELVKVVKLDRYSQQGFSLLGEVLVRRGNYDVAVKALQRACDLDPLDERTQKVLERARVRRPLDPPPPIPGETEARAQRYDKTPSVLTAGIVPPLASVKPAPDAPLAQGSTAPGNNVWSGEWDEGPTVVTIAPEQSAETQVVIESHAPSRGEATVDVSDAQVLLSQPAESFVEEPRGSVKRRSKQVEAAPPPRIVRPEPEPVRPAPSARPKLERVPEVAPPVATAAGSAAPAPSAISVASTLPAAHDEFAEVMSSAPSVATLATDNNSAISSPPTAVEPTSSNVKQRRRRSTVRPVVREHPQPPTAEDFYNNVLGAGQPAPREKEPFVDDGLPVEQWGQRVKRPFLWLWIGLLALTTLAAGWTVADIWARNRAVKRHLAAAHAGFIEMSALSLQQAHDEATRAIARNPASVTAVAALANARAFALLVYGDGQLADVETAIVAARQRIKNENGDADGDDIAAGEKQLVLGRAAFALAAQNRGADVTNELKAARADLDGALASWPDEPLVYWLNGLARLANGDRAGARDALKQAQTLGLSMARVVLADMDLDEGAVVAATQGYDEVLKTAPQHSLARAGRALAKADAGVELEPTLKELEASGGLRVDGKRAEAWHRLAIATLARKLGDPERAKIELDAAVATGNAEPRFLARAAIALLDDGRYEDAFTARTRIRSRAADVVLPVIDAELLLAGGRADEAMKTIGATDDVRAKKLRGRALLEVGRAGDAVVQLTDALTKAPNDVELKAWLALAKLTANPSEGTAPLAKLVTDTAPPVVRAILGEGYMVTGDTTKAKAAFEGALTDNPLAYRAGARLAELALAGGKTAEAEGLARTALASAPGYLPAHSVLGRALVALGRQSEGAPELQLVVDAGRASAADELAYAEAALASGEPELAKAAVLRAKEKGGAAGAVQRVAALVDPQLASDVAPAAAPAPAPAAPKKKKGK